MTERDATARLRRAVKENNLFLVKRLVQRTDMRNPDPAPRRYTSLAWAAALGHEDMFEFLLTAGHDDEELSKDSENNTVLMLLCDMKPATPYYSQPSDGDVLGAALRMMRMYVDRYPWVLDWSNVHGRTPLHMAALKGEEDMVRMLCDLGADVDLSDNKGNTPLHIASSWGHIPIVQLLIERGCQFTARNNEGYTASDYAYSYSTRDTLQESARNQFEINKRIRRNAQAAARSNELGLGSDIPTSNSSKTLPIRNNTLRMRSSSGGSRTTATSDSGDLDSNSLAPSPLMNGQASISTESSSPSQLSAPSLNGSSIHKITSIPGGAINGGLSHPLPTFSQPPAFHPAVKSSALAPILNRMRERDADAMQKYMHRNRSGSAGTASSSTDAKSPNDYYPNYTSAGPSANGDDISALQSLSASGSPIPLRRLRPSMSAAQLRGPAGITLGQPGAIPSHELRSRSGTNPTLPRPTPPSPLPPLTRSSSTSASPGPSAARTENTSEDHESYTGPPSQYAQFPEPQEVDTSTPTRRIGFNILAKSLSGFESAIPPLNHRRGSSANSSRNN